MAKDTSELGPTAEKVLDVAEQLVQAKGYNGFSYDDIAEAVGIRKASIHHHFRTKADLVATVARRHVQRFDALLEGIEQTKDTAHECLLAYAALFAKTYSRDRRLCVCGMLGAEADDLPPDVAVQVKQFFTRNVAWLTKVFAKGRSDKTLVFPGTPAEQAEVFLSLLEGSMVVGRGLHAASAPSSVAKTFLAGVRA